MMETLTRPSSSRLFSDNYRVGGFLSHTDVLGRPRIRFFSSQRHFSNSVSLQHKRRIHRIFVTSPSSSETQMHLRNEETQNKDASKKVHVKFQLQKECVFGEQIYIVGDDPLLGSWDPSSAILLDWSDGHVWTVELDMPIGKSIQFKFLLQGAKENILWQPGPDRILQTWETENTISVSEDWGNPELQMLMEEEPTSNQKAKSVTDVNGESASADVILKPLAEKSTSIAAENIGDPVHSNSAAFDTGNSAYYAEQHVRTSNNDMNTTENYLGNNGTAKTVKSYESRKDEPNLVSYKGDLVLVPGLTPLTAVETEETSSFEVNKTIAANVTLGVPKEAKELNMLKSGLNKYPSMASSHSKILTEMVSKEGEELHGKEQEEKLQIAKEILDNDIHRFQSGLNKYPGMASSHSKILTEMVSKDGEELHGKEQEEKLQIAKEVLENDIHWGRKTLQKLLSGFGFLQHQIDREISS